MSEESQEFDNDIRRENRRKKEELNDRFQKHEQFKTAEKSE